MFQLRSVALLGVLFLALLPFPIFAANTYYLPQAAVGTVDQLRFLTQISLWNPGASASEVTVNFYDNDGRPWAVATSCIENATLTGFFSKMLFELPGSTKYAISMSSAGVIQAGWIAITSEQNLGITATYGFYDRLPETVGEIPSNPLWEAAVLPSPSAMELNFPAHSKSGDIIYGVDANTGYAICNPNDAPVTVTATMYNAEGVLKGTETITLHDHGHLAQFINELFEVTKLSGFRGVVKFSSTAPIAGLAMRESKREAKVIYSTIPVLPDSNFKVAIDYDREPNTTPADSQPIAPPVQIYGTVSSANGGGSRDYYAINLAAGQRLEVIVLAGSIGSPLHPVLTIRDHADVQLVNSEELFLGANDRRANYTATDAGVYFIRMASDGTDSRQSFYRLFVRVF